MRVPIRDIDIRGRSRKSLGDIEKLAASIERLGLLHPVVVTPENKLVVGRRRMAAASHLGWKDIPVNVARNLNELELLLEAERDENDCREDLIPEEQLHLANRFEEEAKRLAKEEQKAAGGDKRSQSAKAKSVSGTSTKRKQDNRKRAKERQARAVGTSAKTLAKIKAIVESGEQDLIDEMNAKGKGKINGIYKRLITRQNARQIKAEPPPMPKGPFRVLVVDPPWTYDNRADDASHRAANPYPSMTIKELCTLAVGDLACKDSVLWLWTTNAHLPEVWDVIDAWGFTYKTMLTWGKTKMGLGDWLRGKTEHCLLCIKGKPTVTLTNQTTLLIAENGRHSAKPDEFYLLVEKLCPGSKVELFQRTPREGWTGHGNEI